MDEGAAGGTRALPLHRLYHPTQGDHLYTTSEDERRRAMQADGYYYEGAICLLIASPEPGCVPLLRLDGQPGISSDHYYTTSGAEAVRASATGAYSEGYPIGYVPIDRRPGTMPLFELGRLPGGHWHFYTVSESERETAVLQDGYAYFGEVCQVLPIPDHPTAELRTVGHSTDALIVARRAYRDMLADFTGRRIGASIVFADVEGSGPLKKRIGLDRWARITRILRETVDQVLDLASGYLVNSAGDALLLAFSSASEAVRFAIQYQDSLRAATREVLGGEELSLRIGIHQGDIRVDEAEHKRLDITGLSVDRAERIQEEATNGRILVSAEIQRAVVGDGASWSSSIQWVELGTLEPRGQEDLRVDLFELRQGSPELPPLAQSAERAGDQRLVGRAVTIPWQWGHRQGVIERVFGPPGSRRLEVRIVVDGDQVVLPFPFDSVTFL
jgi:class 3 adenylate cyclase